MAGKQRWLTMVLGLLIGAGCAADPARQPDPSAVAQATPPPARPGATSTPQPPSASRVPSATPQEPDLPTPRLPPPRPVIASPTLIPTLMPTPELAVDAASFVVPFDQTELAPRGPLGSYSLEDLQLDVEVQDLFEQVYRARSLARGSSFEVLRLRSLVGGAYADYTLPLFNREVSAAKAGNLLEVSFSAITTQVEEWDVDPNVEYFGIALVSVTRTRTAVRPTGPEPPQTATYRFRAARIFSAGGGVAWVVEDFFNPATNRWVSDTEPGTNTAISAGVQQFFESFYAARTFTQADDADSYPTYALTGLSYQAYTMPLLERQIKELAAGSLLATSYQEIKTRVLAYDPNDTDHGGLATVEVTRTALVTRPGGPATPQTATLQFRLHRHFDESGAPYWLAVDFFQPDAKRWVSAIAGLEVPVPPAGYG